MSVPSTTTAQATFASTLVDEWIRHGLVNVVLCPGSRSTPMVLAVAARPELQLHVRVDERSAAFFALGCSLRTDSPTLVVVTSGTAAMELHAAVAEASHARVPLLVVTSDRPPDLHDVGAAQTARQRELFGPLVRAFAEPGVARDEARDSWRPLAARLFRAAAGNPRGPVHLNAAFTEPLLGTASALPEGRTGGAAWISTSSRSALTWGDVSEGKVLVVAGPGASDAALRDAHVRSWPVLGSASVSRGIAHYDAILRDDDAARRLTPDLVLRTGGLPASKILQSRLREWRAPTRHLEGDALVDPDGHVSSFGGAPLPVGAVTNGDAVAFAAAWETASSAVGDVAGYLDDPDQQLSEISVARVVTTVTQQRDVPLVVGSSMPVRDVEWWTTTPRGTTFANRGLNGIDGVSSTVLGVAAGHCAVGLLGDITFLHDVSALTDGLGEAGGSAVLVVNDNDGGGIFSFLPQASALATEQFDRLFATPRRHDLVSIARSFGHAAQQVTTVQELRDSLTAATTHPGVTVLVARVPHHRENVVLHEELNALAVDAVRSTVP